MQENWIEEIMRLKLKLLARKGAKNAKNAGELDRRNNELEVKIISTQRRKER